VAVTHLLGPQLTTTLGQPPLAFELCLSSLNIAQMRDSLRLAFGTHSHPCVVRKSIAAVDASDDLSAANTKESGRGLVNSRLESIGAAGEKRAAPIS